MQIDSAESFGRRGQISGSVNQAEEETKNERITENGVLQPSFKGSSFSNYSIFGTKPEDKPSTQFGKSAFGGDIARIHCVPKRSRIASVVAGHGICAQKIR